MKNDVAVLPRSGGLPSTAVHLLSGGTAGLISAVTLQPFDLLKTRLQQQQKEVTGYRTTIGRELRKLTNVKDLWRGVLPSAVRTTLGAGLYFTILSESRGYLARLKATTEPGRDERLLSVLPKLSHFENLTTGFVVRAFVGVLTMPITIIKTRFESSMYNYNSMYEGFESIYMDGGHRLPRNFFKGTLATLARDCPYAGLYVLFYEGFKNELFPVVLSPFKHDLGAYMAGLNNSVAAILAASVATTITAPFDAIKTRLQLNYVSGNPPSIAQVTRHLVLEPGGVKNLFNGLSLRLGRKGLSAGISWCIYEELIKIF